MQRGPPQHHRSNNAAQEALYMIYKPGCNLTSALASALLVGRVELEARRAGPFPWRGAAMVMSFSSPALPEAALTEGVPPEAAPPEAGVVEAADWRRVTAGVISS